MSSEKESHGISCHGVPHSAHASTRSVCVGAEARLTKFFCRSVHCCCCINAAYYEMEDWIDRLEDDSLFGCLFETGEISPAIDVDHAGVTKEMGARHDDGEDNPNHDTLQDDHWCGESICRSCLNICQLSSGNGQSTSSCGQTNVCLDLKQENICLR